MGKRSIDQIEGGARRESKEEQKGRGTCYRIVPIMLCLLLWRCGNNQGIHTNITVYSPKQAAGLINGEIPHHINTVPLPGHAFPVCGTVSHHLLVSPVINAWFRELKSRRTDIRTFIIISPNHDRSGSSNISFSSRDWNTAGSITRVSETVVRALQDGLQLKDDINHYYPGAEIDPILVDEKRKAGALNAKLADGIFTIMNSRDDVFLIISADFSHRFGRTETDRNDVKSRRSLLSLTIHPARPCTDNTTGMMILYSACKALGTMNTHIFCHTDAEKYLSTTMKRNITSYFFTFHY